MGASGIAQNVQQRALPRIAKNTILRDGVNDAQVEMAKKAPNMGLKNAKGNVNPATSLLGS